jgi:hypothetical protein
MRRITTTVSLLVAAVSTFLMTAPAAFAERLAPPPGGSTPVTAPIVTHHSGLYAWEIGLIVAAGVVLVAAVVALALRLVRRPTPRPALP